MKNVTPSVLILLLTGCMSIESRNEKIRSEIYSAIEGVMDKNRMERIDSISIGSVDSLTDKAKIYLEMDHFDHLSNSELSSATMYHDMVKSHKENIEMYNRVGVKDKETYEYYYSRIAEDGASAAKCQKLSDSFRNEYKKAEKLYASADGNKIKWHLISGRIYFTVMRTEGSAFVYEYFDKDFNLIDKNAIKKSIISYKEFYKNNRKE